MRPSEDVLKRKDSKRFNKESNFSNVKNPKRNDKMDTRYWKELENMGDMEMRSDSGSDRVSPRYRKESSDRRRRSKSRSHSRSHSRSRSRDSSASSSSSSGSSSSSSRRHSDYRSRRSTSKSKRDLYVIKNSSRVGSGYSSKREEDRNGSGWFPPSQQNYPSQGQDIPASATYIPPPYPSSVQGSYPANFQGQQTFGNNYHGYPGYESTGNYYPPNPQSFASQPPPHEYSIGGPPATHPPASNWEMFPDTTQPPPLLSGPGTGPISGDSHQGLPDIKAEEAKKEAIEQELLQQKRTLAKQREDYVKRKFSLNRELNRLKDQKRELLKENSKDNERILRENAKLQNEILQKLKSIDNVIEMLSNIIGDSARLPEVIKEIKSSEKAEKKKSEKRKQRDKSEDRRSSESVEDEPRERDRARETDHEERDDNRQKDDNRVYYDPGIHWCSECNVFPKTVSEYLDHLHTSEHKQKTKLKFEEFPWHAGQNLEEKVPQSNKDSPPKRIAIRGVQFLVPATAWFCSMCKVWLGDMHCATKHMQSTQHSSSYNDFIMKNQHWEVDWLTERTKSYERNSEAKQQQSGPTVPQAPPPPPTPFNIASLSDQLLAMIAANTKLQEPPPPPPPPPPITKSSSSSEYESPGRKTKKKKKKSKKSKRGKEGKSPSKELDQIKLNYKAMTERKASEPVPADDSFISEWMPKVDKREPVPMKPKQGNNKNEGNETVRAQKRTRKLSVGSQDSGRISVDRIISPYDQPYDDHDEAVVFEKRPPVASSSSSYEKELLPPPRSKKKEEEPSRHERHSKYDRSPKEKSKYEDRYSKYNKFDKYKQSDKEERDSKYDDHKSKKDIKSYGNERDKPKKSPLSRLRELKEKEAERKKGRGKFMGPDKHDDEDIHETSFEKRTSESAAKKKDGKKAVPSNLPKTKLPFIGRMPILKKKVEQKPEEKEEKKDFEDSASKDSIPEFAMLQEPVIEALPSDVGQSVEELPKSTLIISKRPRLAEPGIVKKEILFNKPANDNLTEQDMELDDDSTVPKEEEPAKDELHKDFKDALDLLFPEEKKSDNNEEPEVKPETEPTLEEQQAIVASAAPTSYMVQGYDMSMYQTYYDHAYVQQWAQMGYDQTGQYAGAYAYPPPMEGVQHTMEGMQHMMEGVQHTMEGVQQATMEVVVQPTETLDVSATTEQPKKKKNPLSQRMRRHLQKKKAKEAADRAKEGGAEDDGGEMMEGDMDDEDGDDLYEGEEQETENEESAQEMYRPDSYSKERDMSDLALLGIDEDDAAAQGLY